MKIIIKEAMAMRAKPKIFYHGTNHDIEQFSVEFTGKGNNQYGPGIYITDSLKLAQGYGKNVYEITLKSSAKIRAGWAKKKPPFEWIRRKAKRATDWEDSAMNWDSDPKRGLTQAAISILEHSEDFGDAVQQLWIEFFKGEEPKFCNIMAASLIDGIAYKVQDGIIFITLFNPAAIKGARKL